jgi:hypothetical protein
MATTYEFEFKGKQPLLMHQDNIAGQELIKRWQKDPKNKAVSEKGDDRSPAWTWQIYLYTGDGKVVMPSECVMSCIRKAGAMIEIPGGKRGKTFKDATQYGIIPADESFQFFCCGKPLELEPITALWEDNDFAKHQDLAKSLGFELFVKRAKIGQSKHIRVRPMFKDWSIKGSFVVTEQAITSPILAEMLMLAGDRVGQGDWRPSSKTPGPYGTFNVNLSQVA